MKNVLFSALLMFLISCHNTQTTSTDPALKKMAIEQRPYLEIEHAEKSSLIRTRLLKMALDQELHENNEDEESNRFEEVLFKFKERTYVMPPEHKAEYQQNLENSAQVIVSSENKLQIFFLPAEFSRVRAIKQLGLLETQESKYYWLKDQDNYLKKNKTYYVVCATKNELKDNDVFYHSTENKIGKEFNEHYFQFAKNQLVEVKLDIKTFIRSTFIKVNQGKTVLCKKDLREAGLCDHCTYKQETAGPMVIVKTQNPSEALVDVLINGKTYDLNELGAKLKDDGFYHLTLDFKKLGVKGNAVVEFHQSGQFSKLKKVLGFDYASGCVQQDVLNEIDVTPFYEVDISLKIFGRDLSYL